jgi:hypothetical protein
MPQPGASLCCLTLPRFRCPVAPCTTSPISSADTVTSADPAGGALTLRRKLEVEGESRLLHTVRGVGFVLREDPL